MNGIEELLSSGVSSTSTAAKPRKRLRLPRARTVLAGRRLAGAALVASTAALTFAPLPSTGCPSAVVAYVARDQPTPSDGGEPGLSDDLTGARAEVSQAQAAVDEVDQLDGDATDKMEAANKAQDEADAARAAADSASFEADYSDPTSSAELDVQMAQDSVDSAEESVKSAQDMLDTDREYGFDTSFDEQEVQSAKDDLAAAKSDLASKQAALTKAQGSAASAQSSAQSKDAQAKKLQAEADKLQAAAEKAQSTAESRRQEAGAALSRAQAQVDELEAEHTAAVNAWTASHLAHVVQVRALNAERADCRQAATRSGGAAAALLVTGLLLLIPLRAPRFHRLRRRVRVRRG